jgi:methionine aminopeptidase
LAEACIAGAKVLDLCTQGDALILQQTDTVFNKKVDKKPVAKGIAFPTCVSVNNVLFHCCPVEGDAEIVLANGDLVKM